MNTIHVRPSIMIIVVILGLVAVFVGLSLDDKPITATGGTALFVTAVMVATSKPPSTDLLDN